MPDVRPPHVMLSRSHLATLATLHAPASLQSIEAAQVALGLAFPRPYVALLQCSNGLEPLIPSFAIGLFSAEELYPMAQAYDVPINLPDFLFIGFDGGCRGILLDIHSDDAPVYLDTSQLFVPEGLTPLSNSLLTWVDGGFALPRG